MTDIKTEYEGIEIQYYKPTNKWRCIVGGKEYDEDSLRLAEIKIDEINKAIATKMRKNFEPIPAFHGMYHGRITSIALDSSWRGQACKQVWFVTDSGDRSKLDVTQLSFDTEETRAALDKIKQLRNQLEAVQASIKKMSDADLPKLEA